MQVARVAVPRLVEKRTAVPWLFIGFFTFFFFWLFENDVRFAFGFLVSASTVVAAIETGYAGMYWCTAGFTVLALIFNPYVRVLPPLDPPIAALAMVALFPMLLLFACRKTGPYIRTLPDGSTSWSAWARALVEVVE